MYEVSYWDGSYLRKFTINAASYDLATRRYSQSPPGHIITVTPVED